MTTFYPGTIIPMASSPLSVPTAGSIFNSAAQNMVNNLGAPVNTSPSFAMGQGTSPVNNINGGLAPTASFNSFSANPPQPSFNSFSSSPSNLTGIPQRTTSGFNPTFFRGSFPTMSPTMSGPSQSFEEPAPTEGSFSGQSFTPTNSFVDNPFYSGGTSSGFGTQVASLEPSIGFGTNPFTNGNVTGGIQSNPYPGVTGGIQPAPMDFGFGSTPLPRSNPLGPYNAGMGTIQPAPQDFGFGNPGNLPPLPPTNPLGPFNAGMGSIQGAPQPTPFEQTSPYGPRPGSALYNELGYAGGQVTSPYQGSQALNPPGGMVPTEPIPGSMGPFGFPGPPINGESSTFGNTYNAAGQRTFFDSGDPTGLTRSGFQPTTGTQNSAAGIATPYLFPRTGSGFGTFQVTPNIGPNAGQGFMTQQIDNGPSQAGPGYAYPSSYVRPVDISNTLANQMGFPANTTFAPGQVTTQMFPNPPMNQSGAFTGPISPYGYSGGGAYSGPPISSGFY